MVNEIATSVTFRPAVPDDQAFLLQLYASTRLDELGLLDWDENQKQAFIGMQFNAQRQQYSASYPRADSRIILLEDRPAGRILIDRGEHQITLVDIALLTEHRGMGIGTHLIEELLAEAAATAKMVRLHALKSSPTIRLYERLGFTKAGDDGAYLEMLWLP